MEQYNVTGMSCAACSARVEKAVSKLSGVKSCSVSLLTNSMGIEGEVDPNVVIEAVQKAGYGASLKLNHDEKSAVNNSDELSDKQTPKLVKRFVWSLVFMLVLMYFSMGHMMWGWPLPSIIANDHISMGLIQLLLCGIVMVINQRFFISGFKGLIHRSPNMDTLVALGSGASFVWSVAVLFMMCHAENIGDRMAVMSYMHQFYFESAAMILTLITLGKMLESRSKGKTTDALKGLMDLSPKTAVLYKDGKEVTVPIERVNKGDIFIVRPGAAVPVDGEIIEGTSAVNESALTGESIPVDKTAGDMVYDATMNQSGFIRCKATRVGEDTTLSQIIKMVSDSAATKAPIAKIADKVSGIFVPVVITLSLITLIIWLIVGQSFGYALARAISVLVISCPCALGLATPVAIMAGNGVGAKNGILFKTSESLEETGRIKTVALDKTGTITSGEPEVTDIISKNGDDELLRLAYSLEAMSEHPLSRAITKYAETHNIQKYDVTDFSALPGNGLKANHLGDVIVGGSVSYISSVVDFDDEMKKSADALSNDGKTPLCFAKNNELLGIIAVADTIKPESPAAIAELRKMGVRVIMFTGDNERTARAIGKIAGVDDVIAGVMPDGKESIIRKLKKQGKTAMVGDGINDAPALTSADVGIAIGAGADIAIDAADVVLMKSSLADVSGAIKLSRATLKNIHENLFWAFIYNIIGIPLAAGALVFAGITLDPMFGAAAMSLSSFCVVTNALRLNLVKLHGKANVISKNDDNIIKTVHIKGMMCEHCEKRVRTTLESLDEVISADVSHKKGTAKVKLKAPISDDIIKDAVTKQGYKVLSVKDK